MRVLIADDHQIVRQVVELHLLSAAKAAMKRAMHLSVHSKKDGCIGR